MRLWGTLIQNVVYVGVNFQADVALKCLYEKKKGEEKSEN